MGHSDIYAPAMYYIWVLDNEQESYLSAVSIQNFLSLFVEAINKGKAIMH